MIRDLQSLRGRIFFWLGIAVFPVFWAWWMDRRQFSQRQILVARVWTAIYLLALGGVPAFFDRVNALLWAFSQIAFTVGLVLWIWLLLRTMSVGQFVLYLLVCTDIIAIMSSQMVPWVAKMPPHPVALLFVLIPAAVHLMVDPARRFLWGRRNDGCAR